MRLENENNMFSTNGWAVFKCHDYSIELQRVVITSHQNLSAGKCFERQKVLRCVGGGGAFYKSFAAQTF